MAVMLFWVSGEDENIVDVGENEGQASADGIDETLKCLRSVAQPKGRTPEFVTTCQNRLLDSEHSNTPKATETVAVCIQ
ncbi:hypothetical protein M513_03160 [Trichuris suis]|uniref:Uncharacterized protein n=1 Tax=Trichuris suis TaxID=68888 RepID=A0A085MFP0_9BILA|nr:hypothetical protein M513_03160 [Trichuris suis]